MNVARYVGAGEVQIVDEPMPSCPPQGLLVKTKACGLCSGELMSWYMDSKIPHVLGHEVCGEVIESESAQFPVGSQVFAHHHAPCLHCDFCRTGRFVHCAQWKRTKLSPGGMADYFAVSEENLTDTHLVNDLRAEDAALVEPLACVFKGISLANLDPENQRAAVIGLGSMGLLHMHVLPRQTLGFDLEPSRVHWARRHGLQAAAPDEAQTANVVFVCPGSQAAFDQALKIVEPGGTILNFAPLGPGQSLSIPQRAYFLDLKIVNSYSCGPGDVAQALAAIRAGAVKAQQICSHFIRLPELPTYYKKMKAAEILKPMVRWD